MIISYPVFYCKKNWVATCIILLHLQIFKNQFLANEHNEQFLLRPGEPDL